MHLGASRCVSLTTSTGTWRPVPVQFDDAAADEAVRELVLTANALHSMAALLAADAPVVAEDWRGRHRTAFDAESARHAASMTVLADSLTTTATAIRVKQHQAGVDRLAEADGVEGS